MAVLESYLGAVVAAIRQADGPELAKIVRLPEPLNRNYVALTGELGPDDEPVGAHLWARCTGGAVDDGWREYVNRHLAVLRALFSAAPVPPRDVHAALHAAGQAFLRVFGGATRWTLPVLYEVCETLWAQARRTGSPACLEEAARFVNKAFTVCITDRNPDETDSRKFGTCKVASLLFRIYFHLGQLNLCTNVLKAIEASQLPAMGAFPAAHRVTYRYFLGRFHFVNERYAAAEAELALAFTECHHRGTKAKRQILHLLVPCRLLVRGLFPPRALLERHGLTRFYPEALAALRYALGASAQAHP